MVNKGKKRRRHRRSFKLTKAKFTAIIVCLCIAAVVSYDYAARSRQHSVVNLPQERTKGSSDAELKIMKFLDFQCSECARASSLIKKYMLQYPNEIFVGIRYFPHDNVNSVKAAVYAECAARQDEFWPYHDELFRRQSQWMGFKDAGPFFKDLVYEAGLDMDEFQQCLDGKDVRVTVLNDKAFGEARFVQATPTFLIGKEVVVGYQSFEKFMKKYFEDKKRREYYE